MIKIINSNLLDVTEGIICHQVNCKRVMGSGLAKQIRAKYPSVYGHYLASEMKLGQSVIVNVAPNLFVANLFGQDTYGRTGVHTKYKALSDALSSTMRIAKANNVTVHLPYNLGCGLAGGDWSIVEHIIKSLSNEYGITVYIHKL